MAVELAHNYFLPIVHIILRSAFLANHILSGYLGLWVIIGQIDSGDDVFVFEVRGASVGITAFFCDHLIFALH